MVLSCHVNNFFPHTVSTPDRGPGSKTESRVPSKRACRSDCSRFKQGIVTSVVAKAEIEREIRMNVGKRESQYGGQATGSTTYKRSKHETIRLFLEGFRLE